MSETVRIDDEDDDGAALVARDAQARVGTTLADKYRLLRLIGVGGMGIVYEALHAFTHRRVAIKLIRAEFTTSPRAEARFAREARATATLTHPGVVDVLDGGKAADGTLYLVEELLDGMDFGRWVATRAPAPAEVARLGAEVLDGLAAAHARGLIHRDVKPENIFVVEGADGTTHTKIVDFGIVRWTDVPADDSALAATGTAHTQTGAVVGTPVFMSPEQARGESVDERTDLWSLGAVLFHALTGRHPIQAESYNALIVRLATQPVPQVRALREGVPEDLARVVDRALLPNLGERWPSAVAMAAALRACTASDAEVAAPGGPPMAMQSPSAGVSRPTVRGPFWAAAGLIAGGLVGAALWPSPHAPTRSEDRAMEPPRVAVEPPRRRETEVDAASAAVVAPPVADAGVAAAVVARAMVPCPQAAARPMVRVAPRPPLPGAPIRSYE